MNIFNEKSRPIICRIHCPKATMGTEKGLGNAIYVSKEGIPSERSEVLVIKRLLLEVAGGILSVI